MSRVRVEWPAGEGKWYNVKVPLRYSKKGNMFVRIGEQVYVFKNMREGQPVLTLKDGKWVQAGRVVYGTVFIGGKDELSYEEYLRSPEGVEASRRALESLRKRSRKRIEQLTNESVEPSKELPFTGVFSEV